MNKLHKKILSVGFGCFIAAVNYTAASQDLYTALGKSPWTSDEDAQLRSLVSQYGTNHWSAIATQMSNRNAKQCRERCARLGLLPLPSRWAPEEDTLLTELVEKLGHKWNNISRFFTNRSDINCKNRWNTIRRTLPLKIFSEELPAFSRKLGAPTREIFSQELPAFSQVPSPDFRGSPTFSQGLVPSPDFRGSPTFSQGLVPSPDFLKKLASGRLKMEWNLTSAFRESLCGYSALLAAQKINEIDPRTERSVAMTGGNVVIKHSEVLWFAKNLERELRNYGIAIDAPLSMDYLESIAQYLRLHIILEVETPYGIYSYFTREFNPDAPQMVKIYFFADQTWGHYQIITPVNVTVHYEDDCPPSFSLIR